MADTDPKGPSVLRVPEGDNRERLVCPDCGFIQYENPKIVAGAVCTWGEKILLCRRAIEPRRDYWTLPAGYLELNETTLEGAIREAWEEALAIIEIDALLSIYSIPRISQVQLFYRARLLTPEIGVGPESLEVGLFDWEEIPWDRLSFPTVRWALHHYRETRDLTDFAARTNPTGENGNY
ncbi:NUDIX hydrolase [Anthocerotibacter panamensis]|uniref:NUDIX hydrolase n=1 Tax=Anthocerotibacter panamensis TaxID=2857077 RepID=UPI001C40775E|nr:NUDIX hydrolase [Anthocerotibacter panamensis]